MQDNSNNAAWPHLSTFLLGAIAAAVVIFILLVEVYGPVDGVVERSVTYTDISVILLTSVAVIVTAMGVIMAFLAFFGFRSIQNQARAAAANEARAQIKSLLDDGGTLRDLVEDRVDEVSKAHLLSSRLNLDDEEEDVEWSDDEQDEEEGQEPAAQGEQR